MEKILFIVPPHIRFKDFVDPPSNFKVVKKKDTNFGSLFTDMPLGILSLSAYLKKNTHIETKLVDFNIVLNKIGDFKYNSSELWATIIPSLANISSNSGVIALSVENMHKL